MSTEFLTLHDNKDISTGDRSAEAAAMRWPAPHCSNSVKGSSLQETGVLHSTFLSLLMATSMSVSRFTSGLQQYTPSPQLCLYTTFVLNSH